MNIGKKQYKKYADARAPRSPLLGNCARAFLIGGLFCTCGQGMNELWESLGMSERDGGLLTSTLLVVFAAVLTSCGVFDNLARVAGAGTLLPITGFANAVVSSAIDSRDEGLVLGVGAKIFTVAGPVLLYGTLAGALYGIIYFFCTL